MKAPGFFEKSGTTHPTMLHHTSANLNPYVGIIAKYVGHIAGTQLNLYLSISTVVLNCCHVATWS
jgi:hypothetical protein